MVLEGRLQHGDTLGNEDVIIPARSRKSTIPVAHRADRVAIAIDHDELRQLLIADPPLLATEGLDRAATGREAPRPAVDMGLPAALDHRPVGAVAIHQRGAVLWGGRLRGGESATAPDAPHTHVFVARGETRYDDIVLQQGDAVRTSSSGPRELMAGPDGAELLIWATD
jgi:hypothetical protein